MSDIGKKTRASSVTRAIRVLGDRWSILIIRDAFMGVRRFQDFLERTGTSRATLTNRLQSLVRSGILKRVKYSDAPARFEYRLTDKGSRPLRAEPRGVELGAPVGAEGRRHPDAAAAQGVRARDVPDRRVQPLR
jgi:DNA-binding HxlR family transcriptional regulator